MLSLAGTCANCWHFEPIYLYTATIRWKLHSVQ